jgi:O-antigen/teichoic acid export membrane protein
MHSLASSYALLAAWMIYVFFSVRLAVEYLPRKEFGLWAVMAQVVGYITLIELGMTSSVARHLIDHKDRPHDGVYGSVIQTGSLVLTVQGIMILLVGLALSPLSAHLLDIPADLRDNFILLLRWQCGIAAFDFATRILTQILYAHQRSDLSNYADIIGYGVNLLVLWIAFREGCGLYSILWSGGAMAAAGVVLRVIFCWRCQMLPSVGTWGRPAWVMFKELFHYGRDVFLVTLGSQFANASQTIIITRTLGLEAAAVWYVCTRQFLALGEMIWRLFNYAEPMLSEMVVRKEHDQMLRRFRDVVILTGATSALAAVVLAVANDPFVRVWTRGRFFWMPWNNVLLGVWLVIRSIVRCHTGLSFVTKKIGALRFVVFAEGVAFVTLALLVTRFGGIESIIGSSIVCALFITGNYAVRRTAGYFKLSCREVVVGWSGSLARMLAFLMPLALLTWWISHLLPLEGRLVWDVGVLGIGGGMLWLRFGVPGELLDEAIGRMPPPWRAFSGRFLCRRVQ